MSELHVDLDDPPEGFVLQPGDRLIYGTERTAPVGAILYSEDELLAKLRDSLVEGAADKGMEIEPLSGSLAFTGWGNYKAELTFRVVSFTDPAAQEASVTGWLVAIAFLAGLALLGWNIHETKGVVRELGGSVDNLFGTVQTLAVAAALISFVYLLAKGS